jgi:hypothetical protein
MLMKKLIAHGGMILHWQRSERQLTSVDQEDFLACFND